MPLFRWEAQYIQPVTVPTATASGHATNKQYVDTAISGVVAGIIVSHSALTNRDADDHTQYLTSGRADARYSLSGHNHNDLYYTEPEIDIFLSNKSDIGHTHDHNTLSGLANDSHTQYILSNGLRAFSGTVSGIYPILDNHLATKQYVDDTARTIAYVASGVTVSVGTITSGTYTNTTSIDGLNLTVTEAASTPGFNVEFVFSGVSTFSQIQTHVRYNGSSSHIVALEVYNNNTTLWDRLTTFTLSTAFQFVAIPVVMASPYITGGVVRARLYHVTAGNPSHTIDIDYIALVQAGVGGTTDHGSLVGLGDNDHPQYLLANGSSVLTSAWNVGGQSISGVTDLYANNLYLPSATSGTRYISAALSSTDIAPSGFFIQGGAASATASGVNQYGGELVLAPSLPIMIFNVLTNIAGAVTVYVKANSTGYAFASTTNFTLGSDDTPTQLAVTATNLAAAINARATLNTLVTATASGANVIINVKDKICRSFTVSTSNQNRIYYTGGFGYQNTGSIRLCLSNTYPNGTYYDSYVLKASSWVGNLRFLVDDATTYAMLEALGVWFGHADYTNGGKVVETFLQGKTGAVHSYFTYRSVTGNDNLRIYAGCNAAGEHNVVLGTSASDAEGGDVSTLLALATDVDGGASANYKHMFFGRGEHSIGGPRRSIFGIVPTTDVVASGLTVLGTHAYSQAATNKTGGSLNLGGGIDSKVFTALSNTAGTVNVRVYYNNASYVEFASGTDFVLGSDNTAAQLAVTATNLANAINANSTLNQLMVATASTVYVYIAPIVGVCYQLLLYTTQAARISATNNSDGVVNLGGRLVLWSNNQIPGNPSYISGVSLRANPTSIHVRNAGDTDWNSLFCGPRLSIHGSATNITQGSFGFYVANVSTYQQMVMGQKGSISWGSAQYISYSSNDVSLSRNSAGVLLVGNGASGAHPTGPGALLTKRVIDISASGVSAPNVITANETRELLTNTGASALAYHTLPALQAGLEYTFYNNASGLHITASGSDLIRVGAGTSTISGYIETTDVGSSITLVALAEGWITTAMMGTWTVV